MDKKNYQQAIRYAIKMSDNYHSKDLVHDAFLRWYNKTGNDLFDQPLGTILRVVKNVKRSEYSSKGFMFDGVVYPKTFIPLDDPEQNFQLTTERSPEYMLLSKEIFEQVQKGLSEFDHKTFTSMVEGYLIKEITELQNRSGVTMTASVKRIKAQINKVLSAQ